MHQPSGVERRKCPRYPCAGTCDVWTGGVKVFSNCRVSDIGLGGCYVEMISPLPAGEKATLDVTIGEFAFRVDAIVRATHISLGMGLQFLGGAAEARKTLEALIQHLAGG